MIIINIRKGDINGDGIKDANAITTFVNVVLGDDTDADRMLYTDWAGNNDGTPDGQDVQGFVQNYLAP